VFYILVGSAFLYAAYRLSLQNSAHSAFVFLIAILGVAIVLYGTGTHAAGTGTTGNMRVAIAGGAGVLAIVLGVGVLEYSEKIGDVFKRDVEYGLLRLEVKGGSSTAVTTDLNRYDIRAREGVRPLHLFRREQMVEILVPMNETGENDIEVELVSKDSSEDLLDDPSLEFPISWSGDKVRRVPGFANEVVLAVDEPLDLTKTENLPVAVVNDAGESIRGFQITPQ
jgi:hypothetical protein